MRYKGYDIKKKGTKTFVAFNNGKVQYWSTAYSLEWCKAHIDNKLRSK